MTSRQRVAAFIGKSVLRYRDKKLTFIPQKYLSHGRISCTGWVDENEMRIATYSRTSIWFEVFVHETCHIDQMNQRPKWFLRRLEALGKLDDWMKGRTPDGMEKATRLAIELEWDCEMRALRKIARSRLPLCRATYAQRANSYIMGYHWILKTRKWCRRSYEDNKVWSKMPRKMVSLKTAQYPPREILDLYGE